MTATDFGGLCCVCQCRFIDCNKCSIWWRVLRVEEAEQLRWELSVPFTFAVNLKLFSKIKLKGREGGREGGAFPVA